MRWLPRGFLWRCKCRVVGVSRSGFYDWVGRDPSARSVRDEQLLELVQWSHERSRGTYGAPRVHADLTMERGVSCGRKRVARLMRHAGISGVCHQRKRRGWKPLPAPHDDLVKRQFTASEPDRVWFCDITQHRAPWIPAIDAYSRMVVGWSIGDHLRSELVVDALEMARWQRKPAPGTIVHSDRGAQYTSWIFGHRLRQAGLLGSMGKVASSVDNALIESFWSSMQSELLDRQSWNSRVELASAMFEWIEGWYNPHRRHSSLGMVSPAGFEQLDNNLMVAA
jgi:putative transposase